MKPLSLKIPQDQLLLCVVLSLLWGVTNSSTTSPLDKVKGINIADKSETSITLTWDKVDGIPTYTLEYTEKELEKMLINQTGETVTVTVEVTPLTAGTEYNFTVFTTSGEDRSDGFSYIANTRPRNAKNFTARAQDETSITLEWTKVENINYMLKYDSVEISYTASVEEKVRQNVSGLTSMREYNFTLFTLFKDDKSSGINTIALTAPLNPEDFRAIGQNETSIVLQWKRIPDLRNYKLIFNGKEIPVMASAVDELVKHTISGLKSGTENEFTLKAVFETVQSSGIKHTAATAPQNADKIEILHQNETSITLQWTKVDDMLNYTLLYPDNKINISALLEDELVEHTIQNLTSGTKYFFSLFTVFKNIPSNGLNFSAVTAPRNAKDLKVVDQNETSITLRWTKVDDILNYTLLHGKNETHLTASEEQQVTISNLTPANKYSFRLFAVFENVRSSGVPITASTAPTNVKEVTSLSPSENSITLRWKKVGNLLNYTLEVNERERNVTASMGQDPVTVTIPQLNSGTKYNVRLFSLFENIRSSGRDFLAATRPSQVALVTVTERSVDSVTLEWESLRKTWIYFLQFNGTVIKLDRSTDVVSHRVPNLEAGTEYPFSVTTNFFDINSTTYEDFTVTPINCASKTWQVTNSSIQASIKGIYSNATASNASQIHFSHGIESVSFTGLYPGATYNISLVYLKDSEVLPQCHHILTTIPPNLVGRCDHWGGGYSVYIAWDKPNGVWDAVQVNVSGKTTTVKGNEEQNVVIPGFHPAKTYPVSVATKLGLVTSSPYVFSCTTDPRGVIAGSVLGVLLFLALVCLLVFILLKRPDIIRKKQPFINGSTQADKKLQNISVEQFPDHFVELGLDDNRGFSLEYEELMSVGKEQTHRAADDPKNKPRNRFNNVLPYDWCRVKLTTSEANDLSDYINASYMPGYNSRREYIATQGPLPSTVNDFWRMIWEQRVKGIVMVTNCVENGKIKCEQYWPADSKPRLCGELSVNLRSELQDACWTLREFTLKHKRTSMERIVKQFHFTAWPDHGVPQGTEALIQFRGLVRQHMERERTGAPTVVHCSAGVGRTGTIMALDVLLQQLEKEQMVGINAFVHKMRLNRPHMVQTESQYVFLHQCIMDLLLPQEKTEENIYENEDMLYVNATALRELKSSAKTKPDF